MPRGLIALVVVVAACKKTEPPAKSEPLPPVPHPFDAALIVAADAPAVVDVELVRITAAGVRVSSRVANPKILPEHLVDGDLGTAWNSVTGELAGAWILVEPLSGAEIHELRVTPGFTAKGPKGEDWFTMNPRIAVLQVTADGVAQPDITLDVEKREPQRFRVTAKDSVRLEVAKVVMGTKKAWREVSMSELEAWGTPPSGWVSPRPLPAIRVAVGTEEAPAFDPCAGIEEKKQAWEEKYKDYKCDHLGCEDHDYAPDCYVNDATAVGVIEPPFDQSVGWCDVNDTIYGPTSCYLRFGDVTLESTSVHASAKIAMTIEMADVLVTSGLEAVVRTTGGETDQIYVCRTQPTLACSEPLEDKPGAKLTTMPWVFK